MGKFRNTLIKQVKEEQAFQQEQADLKKKHHIKNKNVIVVEKNNTVKFLLRLLSGMLKTFVLVTIAGLAFAGLTALAYPKPRQELLLIYAKAVKELLFYLP